LFTILFYVLDTISNLSHKHTGLFFSLRVFKIKFDSFIASNRKNGDEFGFGDVKSLRHVL
jgi:hypothetical protein